MREFECKMCNVHSLCTKPKLSFSFSPCNSARVCACVVIVCICVWQYHLFAIFTKYASIRHTIAMSMIRCGIRSSKTKLCFNYTLSGFCGQGSAHTKRIYRVIFPVVIHWFIHSLHIMFCSHRFYFTRIHTHMGARPSCTRIHTIWYDLELTR